MQDVVHGTPVVPGVVFGPAIWPAPRVQVPTDSVTLAESDRPGELARFQEAARAVASRLRERAAAASGAAAEVLTANAAMAEDRGWCGAAEKMIGGGSAATAAAAGASEQFARVFTQLGGVMAERVTDLLDIRDRVIAELVGASEPGIPTPEVPSVLLADDLAPADTAGLDPSLIVGLATVQGGPTSHTALIARQLGIPCVVAAAGLDRIPAGARILLDGGVGEVEVGADPEQAEAKVQA